MPARRLFRSLIILAILFTSLSIASPALAIPAEINKSFSPTVIPPGAVSVLTIQFFNPNLSALTNFAVTDNFPSGLFIDANPDVTNTCGATVNAPAGGTFVGITGGTIPAQVGTSEGTCSITVRVTSTQQGNLINTIPANALTTSQGETNSTPASATLTVQNLAAVAVSKSFAPNTIVVGGNATLTINVRNADSLVTLTGVSVTDNLPANVTIAGTPALANCGSGTFSTTATSVTLTGASIPPGATCAVSVLVTSTVPGLYDNVIPASAVSTAQGTTNIAPASATLAVQPLELAKSFTPPSIAAGGISRLRITLSNHSTTAYAGVSLTDDLPSGVTIAASPTPSTTCGGTVDAIPGSGTVTLTGGNVPAGTLVTPATCFFEVDVTSVTAGTHTNTIPADSLEIAGLPNVSNGNEPSAPLDVTNPLTGSKSFDPSLIAIGTVSTLTITLNNPSGVAYTGVTVTDNLPGGVSVADPANTSTTCGGPVTTTASSVTLTGGTIPANSSCSFSVDVTSNSAATYNNTIPAGAVTTDQNATNGAPITASLRVEDDLSSINRPVGSKRFTPATITAGATSLLEIEIVAPGGPLTNVTYTDTFPTNITVVSVPTDPTTGCGPSVVINAPAGGNTVQVSGASIAGGNSCVVRINVTSVVQGTHVNSIGVGDVTATDANGITVNNVINIGPAGLTVQTLTMEKAFEPDTVGPNGRSTATIQLFNYGPTALTGLSVMDNLPLGSGPTLGLLVANPANASTTCVGGAVGATPGSGTVTLSGGTLAGQVGGVPGSCTITFDVSPQNHNGPYTSGSATNTVQIADVTTAEGVSPAAPVSAVLNFTGVQITVNKDFVPLIVSGGETSVLTVRLINPMAIPIVGAAFTDNMPTGMIIASPLVATTTCVGGLVNATALGTSFSFSGGTVPASGECTVSVNVSQLVSGNLTNVIPIGGVTSVTGASNTQPAEASLTYLPFLTLQKVFSPQSIVAGGTSVLTLSIGNTNPFAITGVNLTDNMPAQITVAAPLTTTNTCGGTVSASVGGSSVSLVGGQLAANQTCSFSVGVTSATGGAHVNTIPANAVQTAQLATNTQPVSDTLTVTGQTTASLGDFVWLDANANGIQDAGETGQPGVTVNLFAAGGTTPLATTTTNASGNYLFTGLAAGDYFVEFVLPGGFTFSPQNAGGDDGLDSDADATTGRTANVTLAAGETNLTLDAGLVGASLASLGDFVWMDANANGIQDAGELGQPGVTVNLFAAGGTTPLATTTTNASGAYLFTGLAAGDYFVEFVLPGGFTFSPQNAGDDALDSDADATTGRTANVTLAAGGSNLTLDAGLVGAPLASLGDFVWLDANTNGIQDAGEAGQPGVTVNLFAAGGTTPLATTTTSGTGAYLFTSLAAGDYFVEFVLPGGFTFSPLDQGGDDALDSDADATTGRTANVTLAAGGPNLTLDAGLVGASLASLGDFVWLDANADGIQDAGEAGVAGVTVNLFAADGTTLLATDVSDPLGFYNFANLAAGDYFVEFVLPGGFTFSPLDQGGNDALDSDADLTTGRTGPISLAGGETNLSVDAGLVGANLASLGDFVWLDSNADGIQDAGEPGMGGITVSLFRSDGSPVGTTVTDELGHYLFLNLLPGDYYVEFTLPTGYTFAPLDQGGDDALDSDADPATSRTAPVTLVSGVNTTLDAGLVGAPLASLGDFVWEDSDGDGAQDADEPGIAGVTVRLYTSGGQLVTVTTTDSAGLYSIGNLTPGDYVVEFVLPGGYAFVGPGQGGDPALDSDPDPATGRTATITLAGGASNLTVDAGLSRVAVPENTPVPPAPQAGPAPAVSFFDPALSKVGVLESGALGLPGEQLTWLFTITNVGGATGFNIVLNDTLRPELRVDSADTDRGTVTVSGQTVTFNIPSLAPGESIGARVRTTVLRRPDGGVIVNEGVLIGAGSGGEPVQRIATAEIIVPGSLPATGYAPQPDLPAGPLALGAAGIVGVLLGSWLILRRRRAR